MCSLQFPRRTNRTGQGKASDLDQGVQLQERHRPGCGQALARRSGRKAHQGQVQRLG